ncbi:MAG: glycosyltransferase family 2 protein [Candidatus Eremiobacteraeota bacterium]|nr:glycosyltransferase family 2 protein [Candidatus Eremiobacteraeota bacterium]
MNATTSGVVLAIEILLFAYFLISNGFYILTTVIALVRLPLFVNLHRADPIHYVYSRFEIPVTAIVPAYNEVESVLDTVKSLLGQRYSEHEVVVVNDGSTDETLAILTKEFELEGFPEAYRVRLETQSIRGIYQSRTHPNLRVIDKENGGKADALNAGINGARYPLVFACDGDSYYSPDALQCLVEPLVKDPEVVVSSGAIGVSNDCIFENGKIIKRRLSARWIVRFQVLEYLRAFLSSRLGWAPLNALCIVSGACGLYYKEVLVNVGGFRTGTIWEDMEMTMRVHHFMRGAGTPYRIAFTPFVVCWTRVPDTLGALWNQRVTWQRHVGECITIHRGMLMGRYGTVGWLALPYFILSEWISPLMVVFGMAFGLIAAYLGFLSYYSQIVLLGLVFAMSLAICCAAILLDELSFNTYSPRDLLVLLLFSIFEFFGFRQFCTLANLAGSWAWLAGRPIRGRPAIPGWRLTPYVPSRSKETRD